MKMSDLFELPMVTDGHSVISQPSNPAGCVGEFVSDIECDSGKDAEYVAHAINNHDRLTEENAKLRHELANLIYMAENNTGNEPSLSCFHLAIDEAKRLLLNQLKEQNNDK